MVLVPRSVCLWPVWWQCVPPVCVETRHTHTDTYTGGRGRPHLFIFDLIHPLQQHQEERMNESKARKKRRSACTPLQPCMHNSKETKNRRGRNDRFACVGRARVARLPVALLLQAGSLWPVIRCATRIAFIGRGMRFTFSCCLTTCSQPPTPSVHWRWELQSQGKAGRNV